MITFDVMGRFDILGRGHVASGVLHNGQNLRLGAWIWTGSNLGRVVGIERQGSYRKADELVGLLVKDLAMEDILEGDQWVLLG